MDINESNYIDLETCHEHGGVPPDATRLRVRIDDDRYRIDDPKVTGRQLLTLTTLRPADEYLLYLVQRDGGLESIRLEETVDLRRSGVERFITFQSAASFRFVIDGERREWGGRQITGRKIKELAGVDLETYALWREVRGG